MNFAEDDRQRRQVRPGSLPGLYYWPPDDPAKVRFLDFGVVESYALDPTGRLIATQQAGEDLIKIWAYPSGELVRSFPSTPSDQLQFSPDGRFLAQSDHGDVAVWQVETGERCFDQKRLPQGRPSAVAFSADSKLFAVGDEDDVVIRRTADSAVCLRWSSPGALTALAFGPDGRRLVGAAPEGVWVWDLDLIRRQLRELNLDWSDDPPPTGVGSGAG
jgi:WD40 repeat protein